MLVYVVSLVLPLVRLLLTPMFCASGEERTWGFRKSCNSSFLSKSKISIVQCAVLCLSKTNCLAFLIHTSGSECATLVHLCGRKRGGICYEKTASTPRFLRPRYSDGQPFVYQDTDDVSMKAGDSGPFRRLLVLHHAIRSPVYELDLETKLMKEDPSLGVRVVRSVAYMPKSKRLLLCAEIRPYVFTISLKGDHQKNVTSFTTDIIDVDEEKDVIFLVAGSGRIFSVTLKGENMTIIYRKKNRAYGLTVDTIRKQLYVSVKFYILLSDYRGSHFQTVESTYNIFGLDLDPVGKVLYYSIVYDIFKKDLIKKTRHKVIRVDGPAKDLHYYDDRIYVGGTRGVVEVKGVSGNASFLRLNRSGRCLVCLVP